MKDLSVIIPAKNEPYLNNTIREVLTKSREETDVYVTLDGYEPDELIEDSRVHYIRIPQSEGCHMRQGINEAVTLTRSRFIMKLDAHCLLAEGFDTVLIKAHQAKLVQIPRRMRLDVKEWKVIEDGRLPIDYELIIFQNLITSAGLASKGFIWGTVWDEMTRARMDKPIDDIMHFQGSCWFMERSWFTQCGFLSTAYGGFAQESEEILFGTLKNCGRVVVNKNTYYAHLHKDQVMRQWFEFSPQELKDGNAYSYNLWVRDREFFESFVERFMPIPGWPVGWKDSYGIEHYCIIYSR